MISLSNLLKSIPSSCANFSQKISDACSWLGRMIRKISCCSCSPTDKKTSEAASRALSADQGASVPVDARTSGASSAKASLTPEKSPVVKEIEQLGIPYHPSTSHAQAQAKLTECKEANGKVKRDNYIVYENEGQFYLCSTHVTTDWVGNYLQAKAVDSVSFPVCKISLTDEGWKFEGDGFRFFKSNEPYPSLSNLIERNFKDKTAI